VMASRGSALSQWPFSDSGEMTVQRRRYNSFRNAMDLRDRVQVKIVRRRLKLSNDELAEIVRKAGNSIAAISKEAKVIR